MKYLPLLSLLLVACIAPHPHSEEAHGMKMMALLEKFDRFDYNGDGLLTRKEIELGVRESEVSGVDKKELDAAMKHYDVNKDGFISRWEAERVIDLPVLWILPVPAMRFGLSSGRGVSVFAFGR